MESCFECGALAEYQHHVIPKSRGGTKTVPLCGGCHSLVHSRDGCRTDARFSQEVHFPALLRGNWLHQQYVIRGRSTVDIAREVGCSARLVGVRLGQHGIPVRPKGYTASTVAKEKLADRAWLWEQYVECGRGQPSLAKELCCCTRTVRDALDRHGIARHPVGRVRKRRLPTNE